MEKKRHPTENGSFACSFCSHSSNSRTCLKAHLKTIHNEIVGALECCGIRFSDRVALRHHTKACHHPNYECAVCDKRFYTSTILHNHQLIHFDNRKFKCNICNYATSHKGNIKQHMQRKNHWSGQCEEWRVEPEQRQRYKCHVCNRGYYFQSYLREHMLTHADYKKFNCRVCKYATGRKSHLNRHLKNKRHIFKVESLRIRKVRMPTEINVTERSDSYQERDAVETFSVDRRLRSSSSRTIISTVKIGSPVAKKDQGSASTQINDVNSRASYCYPLRQMDAYHLESEEGNLKQHEERNHKSEPDEEWHVQSATGQDKRQYKCSLCGYATIRKYHLKRHLKTHECKGESILINVSVEGSSMPTKINIADGCGSRQKEDAVETFSVGRRLRSSSRTTVNTENYQSPVVEKIQSPRKLEEESEDQAQSDSHIDIVEDSRESCHPLRQTNANNLESVFDGDIRNNATSSTFYDERLPSQQISSNPSLPVWLDPILEEARQLRSQISRVTTISTVLSILERLMELLSSITNKIRYFGSDYELRFEAAELFEYVWGISKMAVCRWEEMEGSMSNSNTFLRAVQYAYETLPVFINLEIYEHLEMMEHILILTINTVKNCHAHCQ